MTSTLAKQQKLSISRKHTLEMLSRQNESKPITARLDTLQCL